LFIVVESWLNTAVTAEIRGQILSIYGMTGLLAGIGGQMLLPATDAPGFVPFCIVAIILAFALVPIALTRTTAPTQTNAGAGIGLRKLRNQSSFGVVAAILSGVTTGAFFTLGPVFAHQRGLDTREIAIFMASGTLGGFVMALPLGWLSDRFDRRLIIIGAASAAAMTLLAMNAFVPLGAEPWLLYLCVALFGGTFMPTYSIVIAHVNDTIAQDDFVAAAGTLLLVQGVGAAVGPVVAGLAMSAWRQGLSYTLIITQALIAVWGLYYRTVSAAPPEMQKGVFAIEPPVPVGTALESTHSR
jgi:MFS family permease